MHWNRYMHYYKKHTRTRRDRRLAFYYLSYRWIKKCVQIQMRFIFLHPFHWIADNANTLLVCFSLFELMLQISSHRVTISHKAISKIDILNMDQLCSSPDFAWQDVPTKPGSDIVISKTLLFHINTGFWIKLLSLVVE